MTVLWLFYILSEIHFENEFNKWASFWNRTIVSNPLTEQRWSALCLLTRMEMMPLNFSSTRSQMILLLKYCTGSHCKHTSPHEKINPIRTTFGLPGLVNIFLKVHCWLFFSLPKLKKYLGHKFCLVYQFKPGTITAVISYLMSVKSVICRIQGIWALHTHLHVDRHTREHGVPQAQSSSVTLCQH